MINYKVYFNEQNTDPSFLWHKPGTAWARYIWRMSEFRERYPKLQRKIKIRYGNAKRHINYRGCVIDRNNEYSIFLNTHSIRPWPDYQFYPEADISFEELMFNRAEELRNISIAQNKLIQFFWSGGIDSMPAFLALKEVCPDRLFVVTTKEVTELEPEGNIFKKYIEPLNHYVHDNDAVDFFSLANTEKYIVCECVIADQLWNSFVARNPETIAKAHDANYRKQWYYRNRFGHAHRIYRFFMSSLEERLTLESIEPFYYTEQIEKWYINQMILGNFKVSTKRPELYLQEKVAAREFVRKMLPNEAGVADVGREGLVTPSSVVRTIIAKNQEDKDLLWDDDGTGTVVAILNDGHLIKKSHRSIFPKEELYRLVDPKYRNLIKK
jgi:hypothetical protein